MNISVIIPSYNEQDSLIELSNEIIDSLKDSDLKFELIFIDDGSTDNSWNIINNIVSNVKVYDTFEVRAIKFKKNFGKSLALDAGFRSSKGDVVITMDADLQDDPKEILPLYDMIVNDKYDIVSGWKKTRLDPLSKTIPTKLYNWATRKVSGINLHDFNCGLKAYSSDLAEDLSLSGEMHRYIPLIAKNLGYARIGEKVVNHRMRIHGTTKYGGWNRFSNGLLDLISITFLNKFGKTPMHFFGLLGIFSFVFGFIIALYLTIMKIIFLQFNMTDRPLFFLSIIFMIIGSQLFLTGFLAELIIQNSDDSKKNIISKKIGF